MRLPREFIWKDVESMEAFLHDPLNKELYEVYKGVKKTPFVILMPDVKVFNELYYICIGVKNGLISTLEMEEIIFADLGHQYAPSLIISMTYAVFLRQEPDQRPDFEMGLYSWYRQHGGWYFDVFSDYVKTQNVFYNTDFSFRPEMPNTLLKRKYDWNKLTAQYSRKNIFQILSFWSAEEDKLSILDAIERSFIDSGEKAANTSSNYNGVVTATLFPIVKEDFEWMRTNIKKHKVLSAPVEKKQSNLPDKELSIPSDLKPIVIRQENIERVFQIINSSIKGKTDNIDRMRPFAAAIAANAIRPPKWSEFKKTYGVNFVKRTSFYNQLKADFYNGDNVFTWLKEEFTKIVQSVEG